MRTKVGADSTYPLYTGLWADSVELSLLFVAEVMVLVTTAAPQLLITSAVATHTQLLR